MEPAMTVSKYGKIPPRNKSLFGELRKTMLEMKQGEELKLSEYRHSYQTRALNIAKQHNMRITTRKNEDGTLSIYSL